MSDPVTRLNATRVAFVGLVLFIVFVVLLRSPSDTPGPMSAAEGEATEAPAGGDGLDRDSAPEAPGESVARTPAETREPPVEPFVEPYVRTGCFRSGSSRDEVRTVMGAPDSVVFGAWEYGQSWVTFGYGVVLDFSNADGSLRLCE